MLRKCVVVAFGALALGSQAASAADLRQGPVLKAQPAQSVFAPTLNWTGLYVGGHLGAGWGTTATNDPASPTGCQHSQGQGQANPTCFTTDPAPPGVDPATVGPPIAYNSSHTVNGFLGGGQIGFNYQIGTWVWGAEIQASFADLNGQGSCGPLGLLNCSSKIEGLATFSGRLGYAIDRALIYVKGGAAWAATKVSVDNTGAFFFICDPTTVPPTGCLASGGSVSDDRWGWMFGTGIEYALYNNWSTKIEYNYMDFGSKSYVINNELPPFEIEHRVHLVKFGVNYRFAGLPFGSR